MRLLGRIIGAVVLGLLGTSMVLAQPSGCREGTLDQDAILNLIENHAADLAADAPLTSPSASQLGAPSSMAASTALVDQPDFSNFLAFALENDLVSSEDNALTINLNLFAFKAALNPAVISQQSLYGQRENTLLRRFGGAVTLGGAGVAFDRNGDGQVDEALRAEELQDSVVWELRYRFAGTRDRRDEANFNKLVGKVGPMADEIDEIERRILVSLGGFFTGSEACIEEEQVRRFLANPEALPELRNLAKQIQNLRSAMVKVNKSIDSSVVWSLVAGGISREDQLGPDERRIGLRGAFGSEGSDRNWTLNLDWTEKEGVLGAPEPRRLRAALQLSTLWLERSLIIPEGVTVSVSGAYETFQDVPDEAFDTNAKLNLKLDFPLTKAISVPVSVTWANHKDLIVGEDEIRGHIGFTLDMGQLMNIK